jgi:hypothetical protein
MFDDEDREAGVAVFVAIALAIAAAFFTIAVAVAAALAAQGRTAAAAPEQSVALIFDDGSAQLPPDALTRIAPLLRTLREVPGASVVNDPGRLLVIVAYGEPGLATRRAAAVAALLTQAGLSRDRFIHEPAPHGEPAHTVRVALR